MPKSRTLTVQETAVVRAFCEFIYLPRVGSLIPLSALQGALPVLNHGAPVDQKYTEHLRVAIEMGWIERVKGLPDTYRRIAYLKLKKKRSAYMRQELQVLKERMICTLEGRRWKE
jgi:hypothetical protein